MLLYISKCTQIVRPNLIYRSVERPYIFVIFKVILWLCIIFNNKQKIFEFLTNLVSSGRVYEWVTYPKRLLMSTFILNLSCNLIHVHHYFAKTVYLTICMHVCMFKVIYLIHCLQSVLSNRVTVPIVFHCNRCTI